MGKIEPLHGCLATIEFISTGIYHDEFGLIKQHLHKVVFAKLQLVFRGISALPIRLSRTEVLIRY